MKLSQKQYLTDCIAEECAEIIQRCSKILRFGPDEIQPGHELNNTQRLELELNDLVGVLEMAYAAGVIVGQPNRIHIEMKKRKLEQFMEYSRTQGTLF